MKFIIVNLNFFVLKKNTNLFYKKMIKRNHWQYELIIMILGLIKFICISKENYNKYNYLFKNG